MGGFIISVKTPSEYKFLHDLLKKLGIQNTPLSESDIEDICMSFLLKKVNRNKKVSRDKVMKKLRS